MADGERGRRFCSPRCRQAAYRRRSQGVREDLSGPEPGGARRLADREIVGAWRDAPAAQPVQSSWVELYRRLMRAEGGMLRYLNEMGQVDGPNLAADHRLILAERRRLRARFRFWSETIGSASRAGH